MIRKNWVIGPVGKLVIIFCLFCKMCAPDVGGFVFIFGPGLTIPKIVVKLSSVVRYEFDERWKPVILAHPLIGQTSFLDTLST